MQSSMGIMCLPLTLVLMASAHAQDVRTGADAFDTWESDAPGVQRHIKPADLPAPSLTENDPEAPDFQNMAKVVKPPEGEMPKVPPGFAVKVFATGLKQPRVIRIAPNGDVFVSESEIGRVLVFSPEGDSQASPEVFAEGLEKPFGIAFLPPDNP